ncbi:MAG: DNA gyrase C-terminal beta-propeller domain-containing protein, partial [Candidatus Krumholzibacteria bacterium]|nr:DNA gyrase C-terminal beta-propeller domain-containing protein [Candidatus Krumholzibacteria bacterium]
YWLKVHEIPQAGRLARGKAIVNLLEMSREEAITAFVPVGDFGADSYLMTATRHGFVKKTHLSKYANPRRGGIIAIVLREGDALIEATITSGSDDVILAKRKGKAIRFNEKDVREMGRASQGVKGVTLDGDDEVVSMVLVKRDSAILVVTERGYGKRTRLSDFRNIRRGGKGVVLIPTAGRNGPVVAAREVIDTDEVMMITRHGMIIRTAVSQISLLGRPAQGVRVINLNEGDTLVDVTLLAGEKDEIGPDGPEGAEGTEEPVSDAELYEGDEGENGEEPPEGAFPAPPPEPAPPPPAAAKPPKPGKAPKREKAQPKAKTKTKAKGKPAPKAKPKGKAKKR